MEELAALFGDTVVVHLTQDAKAIVEKENAEECIEFVDVVRKDNVSQTLS